MGPRRPGGKSGGCLCRDPIGGRVVEAVCGGGGSLLPALSDDPGGLPAGVAGFCQRGCGVSFSSRPHAGGVFGRHPGTGASSRTDPEASAQRGASAGPGHHCLGGNPSIDQPADPSAPPCGPTSICFRAFGGFVPRPDFTRWSTFGSTAIGRTSSGSGLAANGTRTGARTRKFLADSPASLGLAALRS